MTASPRIKAPIFATWLTQSGRIAEARSHRTHGLSARVEHDRITRFEALRLLCPLKSPLAKGVLLADEVGYGTIGPVLVIALESGPSRNAFCLVTLPPCASQWNQELGDKFRAALRSYICSNVAREQRQTGLK